MHTKQIAPRQDYTVFKKCASISILDFNLFKAQDDFYSCFHIWEDNRHTLFTDKMEFHVLELPKLPKELKKDSSDILLWAKFINAERKEEFDMLATKNQYIGSAYHQLQIISQNKEKRLEYEARQKAIWDYNQAIREAREQGIEQGIEQGEYNKSVDTARNYLALGISPEIVAKGSGLPLEEVEALMLEK